MRPLVAVLGIVWAVLNLALGVVFLASSFTAQTPQHEGILAQLALLAGGALVGAFAVLLALQSWKLMSQRPAR
jgi:hypothetical protein